MTMFDVLIVLAGIGLEVGVYYSVVRLIEG